MTFSFVKDVVMEMVKVQMVVHHRNDIIYEAMYQIVVVKNVEKHGEGRINIQHV